MVKAGVLDPRLALVLKTMTKNPDYAEVLEAFVKAQAAGAKGFGSGALKANGKIFAMVSSKGEFVVKLPKARVQALVVAKQGRYFDAGKGRPMKEWFVPTGDKLSSVALAKEAHAFVVGGRSAK
jgi:hypothetical protein